jgi:hypothetical protein
MIQRLDCSKCGINQADADKPFVVLPVSFICQDCFKQQISLEEQIKELEAKVILAMSQNYCKMCGNILDGYVPPKEKK